MTRGLLDTSVVVGGLAGDVPDQVAVSVVTIGELHAGVLLAPDPGARARRLTRLGDVQREFAILDVDLSVAQVFGELRAATGRRAVADLLIAATAIVHRLVLVTRDERQARLLGERSVLVG